MNRQQPTLFDAAPPLPAPPPAPLSVPGDTPRSPWRHLPALPPIYCPPLDERDRPMHALAGYFSLDARLIAASAVYRTRAAGVRDGTYRRTVQGRCPIGVMLRADGYGDGLRAPDSALAASAIYRRMDGHRSPAEGSAALKAIRGALAAFNDAWDTGEITNLAVALGLPVERASPCPKSPAGGVLATKGHSDALLAATGRKVVQMADVAVTA